MVRISTSIAGLSLQKSEMTDGMQKTDVLIVGAGPAGSVCGYLLQKAGVSCLLIDHATFPRDKICGGGVTPKGWTLLEKLMPGFKYDYNSIRKIKLIVEDNHHCEFDSALELRLVQRKVFDRLLLEQYLSAGGTFQKDAFLQYEDFDDHLVVTLKSGEKIVYSRGLPQFFISDILDDDVVCTHGLEDKKLLLFDDFTCFDEGCYVGTVSRETIKHMRKNN